MNLRDHLTVNSVDLRFKLLKLRQRLKDRVRRLTMDVRAMFHHCEHCGDAPATFESGRTCYHWDGKGRDPNGRVWLCEGCAKEYHDYWDERWSDYYSGLL